MGKIEYKTLKIPETIIEDVDQELKDLGFSSRAELVKSLLRFWLAKRGVENYQAGFKSKNMEVTA